MGLQRTYASVATTAEEEVDKRGRDRRTSLPDNCRANAAVLEPLECQCVEFLAVSGQGWVSDDGLRSAFSLCFRAMILSDTAITQARQTCSGFVTAHWFICLLNSFNSPLLKAARR